MRLRRQLKSCFLTAGLIVFCVQLLRFAYVLLRDEPSLVIIRDSSSFSSVDEEVEDWIAVKTSHPIVNPHPFNFTINCPHMCDGDDVFLLNYVHTSTDHFKQRRRIRGTWANASNYPEVRMKTIFVVGTSSATSLLWWKHALIVESQKYGDIVQENFVDSYA